MKKITPIFVSGIGRSGTSAVIKALSKHKEIIEPKRIGEAPFVHHFLEFLSEFEDRSSSREYNLKNYHMAHAERMEEFSRMMASMQYGNELENAAESEKYWIAKLSPLESQKKKADEVFGVTKIVYVMRNGIEVINSARSFSGFSDLTFEQLCWRWVNNIKNCTYVKTESNCAVVKHHELVSDPVRVFDNVYQKLSISQDHVPSDFIKTNLFNSSFDSTVKNTNTASVFNDRLACWNDWEDQDKDTFIKICDTIMVENDFTRPYAIVEQIGAVVPTQAGSNISSPEKVVQVCHPKHRRGLFKSMTKGLFDYFSHPSVKHSYFYMENPKVASTTILKWLHKKESGLALDGTYNPHERHASPIPTMSSFDEDRQYKMMTSEDIFKFTFVRNPYTRILSAYKSKIHRNLDAKREILAIINDEPFEKIDNLTQEVPFKDFVLAVCSQVPRDMNPHWKMQTLQVMSETIDYDFIGRFENLEKDVASVHSNIFGGVSEVLTKSVNATGSDMLLGEYYCDETLDAVYCKFQDDFQAFGYAKINMEDIEKKQLSKVA